MFCNTYFFSHLFKYSTVTFYPKSCECETCFGYNKTGMNNYNKIQKTIAVNITFLCLIILYEDCCSFLDLYHSV